jgi:hypothetical protein
MPIEPPTDAERDARGYDLRSRAQLVRRDGWEPHRETWSTGEVLGVRAVLNEPGAEDAACPVWAPALWGVKAAELDAKLDWDLTRRWFAATRAVGQGEEFPRGPVETAGELIERLSRLDPGTRVLVDGYEGGCSGIAAVVPFTAQELDRKGSWWHGRYDQVDEARRVAARESAPEGVPELVGEPFPAVVLRRESC